MAKQIKGPGMGSKPSITAKNEYSGFEFGNRAKSMLDIPSECQAELDAAGLEGRWIDVVQLKKNHGWHKREWQPYKFKCLSGSSSINPFGASEGQYEGYLLRQQLVLAAKPAEKAQARRNYVKMKTELQSNPAAVKSKEFREFVRQQLPGAKVHEWDDRDDGNFED